MYRIGYYKSKFSPEVFRCAFRNGLVFVSGQGGWRYNDSHITLFPKTLKRQEAIDWALFGK